MLEIRTVTHLPNSSSKVVQFLHQPVKDFLTTSSSFETIRTKANFDHSDNGHVFLTKFRAGQQLLAFKNLSLIHATEALADLRWSEMFYQARMAEETTNSACTTAVDALSGFVDAHELASVYLLFENWECLSHRRPCFLAIAIQAGLVEYVEHAWARRTNLRNYPGKPLLDQTWMCGRVTSPYIRSAAMVELLLRLGVDIEQEFEGMSALGWCSNA